MHSSKQAYPVSLGKWCKELLGAPAIPGEVLKQLVICKPHFKFTQEMELPIGQIASMVFETSSTGMSIMVLLQDMIPEGILFESSTATKQHSYCCMTISITLNVLMSF